LRYRRHYFIADGLEAEAVKQEFLTHAEQELAHADRIAARIVQLDGEPNFDPRGLAERSHAEYVAGDSLAAMIREDLVAERIAIDSYKEMIRFVGTHDPTTRRLLEEILAQDRGARRGSCCGVSPRRRMPSEHYAEKLCGAISLSFSGGMP